MRISKLLANLTWQRTIQSLLVAASRARYTQIRRTWTANLSRALLSRDEHDSVRYRYLLGLGKATALGAIKSNNPAHPINMASGAEIYPQVWDLLYWVKHKHNRLPLLSEWPVTMLRQDAAAAAAGLYNPP